MKDLSKLPPLDSECKTLFINHMGLFTQGKDDWLEYSYKMEKLFARQRLCCITDEDKKKIFLAAMGAKSIKMAKAAVRPKSLEDVSITYEVLVESIEKYLYPKRDEAFYIKKFTMRTQWPGESFFHYVGALRKIIPNCRFSKKNQPSKLRNQIVSGIGESLKETINPNSVSLSQLFEVGLKWDKSINPEAPPRKRNHKAKINRVPKCFRCSVALSEHADEPCSFEWAVCSSCKVKGHLSIACKYKDIACNKCQGVGHVTKICKAK
ncbi:unnamed protein product [Phyllotreta striolata]|uniref:CCHC-type domain-containing protein n=1 Tax=Phyllotreta striolata TaxID=444603 RepID=A0A9P0DSA2_PHYSR|nr:unnamed protein product [Phyllotreta striolata]